MYPLGRVPTHPFRVLGFAARGKKEGSYVYGGTRDVLLGDADGQNSWCNSHEDSPNLEAIEHQSIIV